MNKVEFLTQVGESPKWVRDAGVGGPRAGEPQVGESHK